MTNQPFNVFVAIVIIGNLFTGHLKLIQVMYLHVMYNLEATLLAEPFVSSERLCGSRFAMANLL